MPTRVPFDNSSLFISGAPNVYSFTILASSDCQKNSLEQWIKQQKFMSQSMEIRKSGSIELIIFSDVFNSKICPWTFVLMHTKPEVKIPW